MGRFLTTMSSEMQAAAISSLFRDRGRDIELKLEDLDAKIKRLESMVETISSIERDQLMDP